MQQLQIIAETLNFQIFNVQYICMQSALTEAK